MAKKRYDPDELVGLEMEPEDALEAILYGAGTDGEEVEMEPEDSETEA
jgi:hypothetical protein